MLESAFFLIGVWRLTAPVSIKVSVEVNSNTVAVFANRTILPPHSVLRPKKCSTHTHTHIHYCINMSCVVCIYYCGPCVFISIRVQNRQNVDVQVVQDVSDVLV